MNPANYVILSAVLFSIGSIGVLVRRNAIVVFLSLIHISEPTRPY